MIKNSTTPTSRRKLVIDRTKWCRTGLVDGDEEQINGESALLNADDCMCCLGFDSRDLGADPEHMRGTNYPDDLHDHLPSTFTWKEQRAVARINDRLTDLADTAISNGEQEALIKAKFAEKGVDVEFIN